MQEYFSISPPRCVGFSIPEQETRKRQVSRFPDLRDLEIKNLNKIPSNDLLKKDKNSDKKNFSKKSETDEIRRKRRTIFHFKKNDQKFEKSELFINIEKKKIFERSEGEKKSIIKPSLNTNSPLRTFYSSKKTSTIETSSQISMIIIPKQFNSYENWKFANKIPTNHKVFIINGNYPDIRKALENRGWVENHDQDSFYFDLKWTRNARVPSSLFDWQLYNHFPRNYELSVKWQLYENIKRTNKVTKENCLNFMPISFRLDTKGFEDFCETFKAIFAVSMLKNFLVSPSNHVVEQIIVANIICRRWVQELQKQNFFEEKNSLVMNIEWKIITSKDLTEILSLFSRLMINRDQDLLSSSLSNIKKLEEVDPQFLINGSKNIWIVKAGRKSRGRDIALFNDLNKLKTFTSNSNSWVVQKYIENPLLLLNRKFDIRQWVLISSNDPLTIWIYKKSYLRFSLENYSDDNISNPFIHLTNNSISKTSTKFSSNDIKGCMWSIEQFQEFLLTEQKSNLWTGSIFPNIKKIVKYSVLAIGNLGRRNSFEILGYDFMIDDKYKPWLLEVNSSPAMDYSTVSIT